MGYYIIRYSGELGTKDKATRWRFIHKIVANIQKGIKNQYGKEVAEASIVESAWNQIKVECPVDLKDLLGHIAGITNFSECVSNPFVSLEDVVQKAEALFAPQIKNKKFAVRCLHRSHEFPFTRKQVEIEVGNVLVPYAKVDLSNPEVTCYIDFDEHQFYMYSNKLPGIGGYPISSQGKALALLSGGIDSPVACFHMFRKGVDLDFLYFDLGSEIQKASTIESYKALLDNWGAGSRGRLIIVDFIEVVAEIMKAPEAFRNMILKYTFYKTAEILCKECECEALVTGESLGQVSTQTLKNLNALDQVTPILIIRPLATLTKEEISGQAKSIGTFDYAYKGKELCALAGKGVVTGTTIKKLKQVLKPLDLDSRIDAALSEKITFDKMDLPLSISQNDEFELPEGYEVIDLRSKKEFHEIAFGNAQNIPFEEAINGFYHWEKDKKYFLVCNMGSQSAILKKYMTDEGFEARHLAGGLLKHKIQILNN